MVIDVADPVKYSAHLLKSDPKHKKPRRLYLDLEKARVGKEIESSIPIKDGLLQRARAGQYSNQKVRVVLDINNISRHKIFPLYDPFRIVVDVRGGDKKEEKTTSLKVVKKRSPRKGVRKQKKPDPHHAIHGEDPVSSVSLPQETRNRIKETLGQHLDSIS